MLTGYVVSVAAQMSFAGLSAFVLSHLIRVWAWFPFSLIIASSVGGPLGLLIGLPALRVRGVNLAVVTLAVAFTIDALRVQLDVASPAGAAREVRRRRCSGSTSGSPTAARTRGSSSARWSS